MLWLGGFLSLDLTTSTPDALCPPLEDARAAVQSRVGEVRGEYHAEFALIRGDDGRQVLSLSLRERDAEVLRRELPLDAAGCQDAAQTIALVLERYFDVIERPDPPAPAPAPAPARTAVPQTRDWPAPRSPPADGVAAGTKGARPRSFGVRAGFLYDRELGTAAMLGASFHPNAWRFNDSWRWGMALELAPFLARQDEEVRGHRVEAFLLQSAFSLPLTWSGPPWRFGFGPWAQLRWQRAQAPSLEGDNAAFRVLPGLGAMAQAGLELAPSWAMLLGVAAGAQLRDVASRYVLHGAAGEMAVLVPDPWFGQAQLALELKL